VRALLFAGPDRLEGQISWAETADAYWKTGCTTMSKFFNDFF
jgi:hypothetical protein